MKTILLGDLHFGEKGNSEKFNQQILDFLQWVIDIGKDRGADSIVQMGDWFHHRDKIQVRTLTYARDGARMLGSAFGKENAFVLEGNHDLFYLDRLDTSSVSVLSEFMTVVDSPTTILDGTTLATPWIASGEHWDAVVNASADHRFLMAHLELNGFMVNERYVMEHGHSHRELKGYDRVFTGHYHTFQEKDNILYLGTPYPITMNEANEWHGIFILDTETGEYEKIEYTGIVVLSLTPKELETLDFSALPKDATTIRVVIPEAVDDDGLPDEIKEFLANQGITDFRVNYVSKKAEQIIESAKDLEPVENIDEAVLRNIEGAVDVTGIDTELMKVLYLQVVAKSKEGSVE